MSERTIEDQIDRMFRAHARGIRTRTEVVDGALGLLAFEGRYDLVEPVTRRLLEQFEAEVKQWLEWDEDHPETNFHWMPYNDSRMVSEYFGSGPGMPYTPEQQDRFVRDMHSNVLRVADMVRELVD